VTDDNPALASDSPFPVFGIAGVLIGFASLIGNRAWNCPTCGWDLDGVPWYQAFLVAGVPFVIAPAGIIALAIRAYVLRGTRAAVASVVGAMGLALSWLHWFIAV
jgi:hypothetical protein